MPNNFQNVLRTYSKQCSEYSWMLFVGIYKYNRDGIDEAKQKNNWSLKHSERKLSNRSDKRVEQKTNCKNAYNLILRIATTTKREQQLEIDIVNMS